MMIDDDGDNDGWTQVIQFNVGPYDSGIWYSPESQSF